MVLADTPHFSCGGVSLRTDKGELNLSFGGAVPLVIDYLGNMVLAHHQLTLVAVAIPEPETYTLMLAGLVLLGATTRRRDAKRF
jgi:hypothetical protein